MKISIDNQKEAAIAQLQQRILACRLCQQHGYIPEAHPITSGRASDRIIVIGQAPGHRSVTKDRPFSGPGGSILQKWLEQAGFPPGYLHEHTYLSSLTHCDPGRNPRSSGDRRPSPPEVALCRPFLEAELQLLQPKIVLLVGSMAIETFLGKRRLEETPHPSGEIGSFVPSYRVEAGVAGSGGGTLAVAGGRGLFPPQRRRRLEDLIGTSEERNGMLLLPLPHPSGVSRWLNDPSHQQLLQQALELLSQWRITYDLSSG